MFEGWSPSRHETVLYEGSDSTGQCALLSGTARTLRKELP